MKAIITGSNGLLGSAVKELVGENNFFHTRSIVDLTNSKAVDNMFYKLNKSGYDTLIHSAAKVGGVLSNMNNNKFFFEENVSIDKNVLNNAFKYNYKNVVTILSTCIFPDKATYPLTINQIDNGAPHDSNSGYAYAKRLLAYETKIYREVTGKNWISIVPTNLYGKNDQFNLKNSHLVPALIRKAYECSLNGEDFIVWGDGAPLRQFVFSEDMAKILIWALENWKSGTPLIAVDEREYSIKEVVNIIASRFKIQESRIKYDTSKPNGQHRKPAQSDVKDFKFISLEDGVNKTIDWFIENYDKIRN